MSNFRSKCGCGETPARVAVMSRTMSSYKNVPTVEIEQNIHWLNEVKKDCDFKIGMLQDLRFYREKAKLQRQKVKDTVTLFCDDSSLHLDIDTRIKIIQQRLGCNNDRAEYFAKLVQKHAQERFRFFRDQKIRLDHGMGLKTVEIARKHDLTRQQVYNILKKDVKQQWRGKTMYIERLLSNEIIFM